MRWLYFVFLLPFVAFAQSCPTGMTAVEYYNYVAADAGVCPAGYVAHDVVDVCSDASNAECWLIEQMRALCGAGVTQLKTSVGVSVPIYSDRATTPSLCISYNNTTCYVDLESGGAADSINVKYNGAVYHTVE